MKNLFKVFGIIALVAVIGFSMVACGGDDGGGGGGSGGDGKLAAIIYSYDDVNNDPLDFDGEKNSKIKHESTVILSPNSYKYLKTTFINGYNGVAIDSDTEKCYKNGELVCTDRAIAVFNGTGTPPGAWRKFSVQDGDRIKFEWTAYDFLKGGTIGTFTAETTIVIK